MPIKYKGIVAPQEYLPEREWTRGKGWSSIVRHRGKDVVGIITALTGAGGATRLRVIPDADGIYTTVEGYYDSFDPADPGGVTEGPSAGQWEIQQNQEEVSIFSHPDILEVENEFTGAIGLIKAAFDDYQKGEIDTLIQNSEQAGYDPSKVARVFGADLGTVGVGRAIDWFNMLVAGVDSYRVYQPVITLTETVTRLRIGYGNGYQHKSGRIPGSPRIYNSTSNFVVAMYNYVFDVEFPFADSNLLPAEGVWLEVPLQIRQASGGFFDVVHRWEWYLDRNLRLYPNLG